MTDQHDPDLRSVDDAARAASRGLHEHVARRVDADTALATLPATTPTQGRGRLLAVAAVAALLVGSVVVLSDHQGGDGRSHLELDEDGNKLPTPQPGTLTALGPSDGKDSIQLPVTIEPIEGLEDGDVVTVSSPGFEPGEQVGIVQCAREAGGDTPETRGGVDGCNISAVEYADADADGVATGRFTVRRVLTTPLTGTVDCAAEANRCLVAMGAISNYDRSGGFGITIAGGEPIDIPTLTVAPAEGLHDGDTVHVEGDGYEPGSLVTLGVCAKDPAACWSTGAELTLDADEMRELGLGETSEGGSIGFIGLQVDEGGRLRGDVPVWRFLPGDVPGTYVDCAASTCALRVTADGATAPAPAVLRFVGGGDGPSPPAVAVDPDHDLAPGDTVVIRGAGFAPNTAFYPSLCVAPADRPEQFSLCGGHDAENRTDGDGTFAIEFRVPDPNQLQGVGGGMATTTSCAGPADCPAESPSAPNCDGVQTVCTIHVGNYAEGPAPRPQFPPAPVVVTFRSAG